MCIWNSICVYEIVKTRKRMTAMQQMGWFAGHPRCLPLLNTGSYLPLNSVEQEWCPINSSRECNQWGYAAHRLEDSTGFIWPNRNATIEAMYSNRVTSNIHTLKSRFKIKRSQRDYSETSRLMCIEELKHVRWKFVYL